MRRFQEVKMDHLKNLYRFFFTVTFLVRNILSLTMSMNQNPIGNLENEADIVCSYIPQAGDIVLTIQLEKKEGTYFVQIATFFAPNLNQNATFANTTTGNELAKRAELTNPTTNNLTAILKINRIECSDEATYKCLVSHVTAGSSITAEVWNNLTVRGLAKSPDTIPLMNPAENILENTDVYFTCTGNVGKPAGTFIWQKYKNNVAVGSQMLGNATTQPIDDICIVNKTSTIKLRLTKEDNMAVVRCTVQQELLGHTFFKQTEQIKIFYEVNKPEILAGTKVTLTCSAQGHPVPTYVWYDSNDNKLKEGPTFEIQNANVNDSGIYKCTASNTYPFNGLTFNQTSSTMLNIVYPVLSSHAPTTQTIANTTTTAVPATSEEATKTPITQNPTTCDEVRYCAENLDSNNNSVYIGLLIGFVAGLCCAGFVFVIILWRKGLLNKTKYSSGNETNKSNGEQLYEDFKNDTEETNYEGITQKGAENLLESSRSQTDYEHLDNRNESTAYIQLDNTGNADIRISTIYVNTTLK